MVSEVPAWLNAHFVQKVLENSESDESIEVIVLTCEPAIGKGENYGSIMIRAKVKYLRIKFGIKAMEEKSLIFKIAPKTEGSQKELFEKINIFDTEIKMMTITLSKMHDILNEKNYRLCARVLHTEIEDPSFLVMEDLRPLGYRMANRQVGLDLDHSIIAIIGLAKFHASSVALYEQDPNAMMTYNHGVYNEIYPEDWREFFTSSMKHVASEVAKWSELGPDCHNYSEKLLKLADVCYDRAIEISKPKVDEFNVLNHGDFWVNNILFRYNEDGKVTDSIFVDFQLSMWSSPAIDILNFFNTSLVEDVDLYHRGVLLKKYLNTLTSTMQSLHCKTKPPSMAQLENSMKERELYGILSSCLMLPIILLDKNEAENYDGMMGPKSTKDNPIYRGLAYRKVMIRRLPRWNAEGSIDV